jgi:hypothetical protein
LKQAPGALYIGGGKEGDTKIGLDDAKAAAGANGSTTSGSTTGGFAARMLDVPG